MINFPTGKLTTISDGLIKSDETWIDFDTYVGDESKSVDTIYPNNASNLDCIEFKNAPLLNELTGLDKGGKDLRNYINTLDENNKFDSNIAVEKIKANHIYLKFEDSKTILHSLSYSINRKTVVISKEKELAKNAKLDEPFVFMQTQRIKDKITDILKIDILYEEDFIDDYNVTTI